jgi:anti-sigma regulatory factor (Ser/Thr protein kinase)
MTRAAVRESVTLAGLAERAGVARSFVGAVLAGHPGRDATVLMASELFSNSVRHSRSGSPGGTVTVTVLARDGLIRLEVTDQGGTGVPEIRRVGREEEGGRGLELVAAMATRWGWRRHGGQTVVWFEIPHDETPEPSSRVRGSSRPV